MSHEFESGFFVNTPAWHRLGTMLDNPPTTSEAIKAAGLDWTVLEEPIYQVEEGDIPSQIAGYKALIRDRDRSVLSVVSQSYQPLQNRDAFRRSPRNKIPMRQVG